MPLDMDNLGDYNPEVEEIKAKVWKAAQEHTDRFHCGSGVEEALRHARIDPPRTLSVEVTFKVPGDDTEYTTEVEDLDLSKFKGRTHEDQLLLAAEHFDTVLVMGDTNVDIKINIEVIDLNVVVAAQSKLGPNYRLIKGPNGRVAHLYRRSGNYRNPECQDGPYINPGYHHDAEAGTPVCKKCQDRARIDMGISDLAVV